MNMKKRMNRCIDILKENMLLFFLVLVVCVSAFMLVWDYSISWCTASVQTVDAAYREFWGDAGAEASDLPSGK